MDTARINRVARTILDAAYRVHSDLGNGLFESVYCAILARQLSQMGLQVEPQKRIALVYDGMTYEKAFRADLVIEGEILVEVKSIEKLTHVHWKQLLTYLRLSGCPLGLLINFGEEHLRNGVRRIVNGLIDQPLP